MSEPLDLLPLDVAREHAKQHGKTISISSGIAVGAQAIIRNAAYEVLSVNDKKDTVTFKLVGFVKPTKPVEEKRIIVP